MSCWVQRGWKLSFSCQLYMTFLLELGWYDNFCIFFCHSHTPRPNDSLYPQPSPPQPPLYNPKMVKDIIFLNDFVLEYFFTIWHGPFFWVISMHWPTNREMWFRSTNVLSEKWNVKLMFHYNVIYEKIYIPRQHFTY